MQNLYRLLNIVEVLRDPEQGCEWDRKQTFSTIVPYTIEEVYEVVDAIDRQDYLQLQDKLGDLLLQIVYYTQMAREQNLFGFDDIAKSISDKLVRRHPNIFDEHVDSKSGTWEEIKQQERDEKFPDAPKSILNDVPNAMPQLLRAKKIQKRAAMVGFDWTEVKDVIEKVEEEIKELKNAIKQADASENVEEELGDLLFSIVNLSRFLKINAEDALRKGNEKFIQRFQFMEERMAFENKQLNECDADELEALWQQAKVKEKS